MKHHNRPIQMLFFLICSLFSSSLLSFELTPLCAQSRFLESIPVQQGGRLKPLLVLADESLSLLTQKKHRQHFPYSTVQLFCTLSLQTWLPLKHQWTLNVSLEHEKTKSWLKTTDITFAQLITREDELRQQLMKEMSQNETSSWSKDLEKLIHKIQLYQQITMGHYWMVPVEQSSSIQWIPLQEFLSSSPILSTPITTSEQAIPFTQQLSDMKNLVDYHLNFPIDTELFFAKIKPFPWALGISFLALLCWYTLPPLGAWSLVLLSFLVQIVGIVFRVIISGRAPITNMYETVMFSGMGALFLSMIFSAIKKEKIFVFVGLIYNVLCLFMMSTAYSMLPSHISPLVPVLRDNFWLSTHVTLVILSYGAFALSWILSNIILIRFCYRQKTTPLSPQFIKQHQSFIYSCLKFGVVTLSAGIILGGIWADYSWGRFWGWDPKETWSLIVLMSYMFILHAQQARKITPFFFIFWTAFAFQMVMMAWFGVNYILATGLHSYGFSQGGAVFLGSFFMIQSFFLIYVYLLTRRHVQTTGTLPL
jgi:cytochrome c-type biogenesis protein CcsB